MKKTRQFFSVLLTLAMLLSLLPTTVLAAAYDSVGVNGITLKNGHYLESNSSTSAETGANTEPSTYVAWYKGGVLTLKGYDGTGIAVQGVTEGDLTIKLIGDNTITPYTTGIRGNSDSGSITITTDSGSSGKLTINVSNAAQDAYGIDGDGSSVTIKGSADVTIIAEASNADKNSYGINSNAAVSILDSASVKIISKTPNNNGRPNACFGILSNNGLTIDTDGTIQIDVFKAGNGDIDSYGIVCTGGTETFKKVGEMQVNWKKGTSYSSPGGAISGTTSFSDTDHAINVDEDNHFASYRNGTPHKVTAGNGTLTGPGVPNASGSGMFLENDTVNITPNTKTGMTGEVIPFKKWTSDDITLANQQWRIYLSPFPARRLW